MRGDNAVRFMYNVAKKIKIFYTIFTPIGIKYVKRYYII